MKLCCPGLEAVRQVTSQGLWNLRIDLRDQNNNSAHATYFHFRLGLEDSFYPLMLDCYIDGTAGMLCTFCPGSLLSRFIAV